MSYNNLLDGIAGAASFLDDRALQSPYYYRYGVALQDDTVEPQANYLVFSWYMPARFKALPQKVLRTIWLWNAAAIPPGVASTTELELMVNTYTESATSNTFYVDTVVSNTTAMSPSLINRTPLVIDIEIATVVDVSQSHVEIKWNRELDRTQGAIAAYPIYMMHCRTLTQPEALAAYAAGTVAPWM